MYASYVLRSLRAWQTITYQGRIQDFKLGGTLKIIAPSGARSQKCLGYFVWKITIYAKKSYFFPILGGGGLDPPLYTVLVCVRYTLIRTDFESFVRCYSRVFVRDYYIQA